MKKATLVVTGPFQRGEIFNRANTVLNRDDCLLFFHDLKDEFAKRDVVLNTQDLHPISESDYIIYNDMAQVLPAGEMCKKSFALLFESELIRPDNYNFATHAHFAKLFTWNDELVDGKKYFKLNTPHAGEVPFLKFAQKKKLCTMITSNKLVSHPRELYSHRKEAVQFFEKNHPEDFDLYGVGWEIYTFHGPIFIRVLNRIPGLRKLMTEKRPSYRGKVRSKLETMRDYKFSICYENIYGSPGYITEKIFDSMAAGCVPIYWGAPNIYNYIPQECFIDRTKFSTHESLYTYLVSMNEKEYNQRLAAIYSYLHSPQHEQFEPGYNAKLVCREILAGSQ